MRWAQHCSSTLQVVCLALKQHSRAPGWLTSSSREVVKVLPIPIGVPLWVLLPNPQAAPAAGSTGSHTHTCTGCVGTVLAVAGTARTARTAHTGMAGTSQVIVAACRHCRRAGLARLVGSLSVAPRRRCLPLRAHPRVLCTSASWSEEWWVDVAPLE